MFASSSNVGIRGRLLAGFALICTLLAATVGYTVYATSEISGRIKKVVDLRAPVAITSTQLVGNLYSTLSTLRGYLLTAEQLASEVQAFFLKIRNGPLDRHREDDPDYLGAERREGSARGGMPTDRGRKIA